MKYLVMVYGSTDPSPDSVENLAMEDGLTAFKDELAGTGELVSSAGLGRPEDGRVAGPGQQRERAPGDAPAFGRAGEPVVVGARDGVRVRFGRGQHRVVADVVRGDMAQPFGGARPGGPDPGGVQEVLGGGGRCRGPEERHDLVDARANPWARVRDHGVEGEDLAQAVPVAPVDREAVPGEQVIDLGAVRRRQQAGGRAAHAAPPARAIPPARWARRSSRNPA